MELDAVSRDAHIHKCLCGEQGANPFLGDALVVEQVIFRFRSRNRGSGGGDFSTFDGGHLEFRRMPNLIEKKARGDVDKKVVER